MNLDKFRKRLPTQRSTETGNIRLRFQRAKASKLAPPSAAPAIETAPAEPIERPQEATPINPPIEAAPSPTSDVIAEGGFQIYKRQGEQKPKTAPANHHPADEIPRDVDPVPMGADAIEEALRLINAEDEENLNRQENKPDHDIGFTPLGIAEDPAPIGEDAIVPGVFGISDTAQHSSTTEEATPQSSDASSHDALNAFGIGQSISHVIKDIVKTEIDHTIDALTRQAVRDALKAHHA